MGLLYDLSTKYKTLSIVGMAKNAGKTTAMNFLIEEAMDEGIRLGITSLGRDGESQDLVTGTEKPKIYLDQDTIVTVPTQLYELADAGLEILKKTRYSTPMGDLLICRVADSGYVQIAGPPAAMDTKRVCEEMMQYGCELILIDGAIDRKSIASPETSDAIILSTGAVLSRSMRKVVDETAHIVNLYSIPEMEECEARTLIEENNFDDKIMLISRDGKVNKLDLATGLGSSRFIDDEIDDDTEYVYIPGAFTNSVIADINLKKLKRVKFILKNPTKIFLSAMDWGLWRKKGFRVNVLKNIEIAAITVNPWAPSGYTFDSDALVAAMQEALPELPIIDVRV
ncbi:MAG: hypothetical protein IKV72_04295 [Firmicutes bacterium]|nr:hypothetical protein [Bacillota bacterium]